MEVSERTVGTVLVLGAAAFWGTNGIIGKIALGGGLALSPILAVRFLIAAVLYWGCLVGYRRLHRRRSGRAPYALGLPARTLGVAVALGAVGYGGMLALYFWALHFMTAGMVSLLSYTYPVFVIGLSVVFLDEYVTRPVVLATALSLVGVGLIAGVDRVSVTAFGVLLAVSTGFVYAVYIVVSRATLADVDARVLTAYTLPATAVAYTAFAVASGRFRIPATADAWVIVVAFVTLGTIVPILGFFAGLARVDASRAGLLSMVEPVVTVGLGAVLLGEPVTPPAVAGGALILLSAFLVHAARG